MTSGQAPAAAFLVREIRRARTGRGLSQEEFGKKMNYSASLISAVENGQQRPTLPFLRRVDKVLETGGLFVRMLEELVSQESAPPWLRPWLVSEREATALRWYEQVHVPGILQTEAYARAVFEAGGLLSAEEVEQRMAARLDRQSILTREKPPLLMAIMDEGALRRAVGGPKVMRDQLLYLARVGTEHPRVRIHVVPSSVGEYPGLGGSFMIASLPDTDDVVYLDTQVQGQVTERTEDVAWVWRVWESTLGSALPPQQSIELILEVAETWS